ncbi:hypothetical protein [Rubritalea tangerina]|uniref:hypothetical protein n=1 Tax=Rubritalea tangerina TaxID=430798 RepID=UPI003607148A
MVDCIVETSREASRSTFYNIYGNAQTSDQVWGLCPYFSLIDYGITDSFGCGHAGAGHK